MKDNNNEEIIKKINNLIKNNEEKFISTNISLVDNFLAGYTDIEAGRGGFLRGKMYSFSGSAGVGKTTFLLYLCKNLCKENKVLYIDVENGVNDILLESIGILDFKAESMEQFQDEKNFFVINAYTYSETINLIRSIIKIMKVDLIIVDSVKNLLTEEGLESDSENLEGMLLDKRVESVFFPLLKNIVRKNEIVICFIQQVRVKKKGMFFVNDESGGNSFLHSVDSRFMLKLVEPIKGKIINNEGVEKEKIIGNVVEIEAKKSRFGMNSIVIPIFNGKGISLAYYYYRLLKNLGYINNKGSMYYIDKIEGLEQIKLRGEGEVYKFIKENFNIIENFLLKEKILKIESVKEENEGEVLL